MFYFALFYLCFVLPLLYFTFTLWPTTFDLFSFVNGAVNLCVLTHLIGFYLLFFKTCRNRSSFRAHRLPSHTHTFAFESDNLINIGAYSNFKGRAQRFAEICSEQQVIKLNRSARHEVYELLTDASSCDDKCMSCVNVVS